MSLRAAGLVFSASCTRGHALAEHGIRHAEDGGITHCGVVLEHALDFKRADVRTAANDQVLLARDEPNIISLALPHQIAGRKPAAEGRILDPAGAGPVAWRNGGRDACQPQPADSALDPSFAIRACPNLGKIRNDGSASDAVLWSCR
jgi:hypothetical protein